MFKWLKAYLDGPAAPVEELPEKRRADRIDPAETGTELTAKAGPCCWPACVLDISTEGIGLILGMFQKTGTSFSLKLVNSRNNFARSVQARVVRTVRRSDGHWFVGCSFNQRLNQDELESLL